MLKFIIVTIALPKPMEVTIDFISFFFVAFLSNKEFTENNTIFKSILLFLILFAFRINGYQLFK